MPDGTPDSPWQLKTPSGQSEYEAWRDESLDPPALVVQVGKTQLRYHLRALDDLHAMLKADGDWVPLGSADEQKPAAEGTVEAWARVGEQPGGRLVRAQEGPARALRQLRAAGAGGAGPRRGRAQRARTTGCGRSEGAKLKLLVPSTKGRSCTSRSGLTSPAPGATSASAASRPRWPRSSTATRSQVTWRSFELDPVAPREREGERAAAPGREVRHDRRAGARAASSR